MDRTGTKTRGEREDEEAARLVRPSPKVKPPRHDKRREIMKVDEDPDLDAKDKDLSMNYKTIGGSVGERVLNRWAKHGPSKSKPAGKGTPAGKVKVKRRKDNKVVEVSKNTLKERPGDFERVKSNKPAPKAEPKPESSEQALADDVMDPSVNEAKKSKPKKEEQPPVSAKPVEKEPAPEKEIKKAPKPDQDDAAYKGVILQQAEKNPKIRLLLKSVDSGMIADNYQLSTLPDSAQLLGGKELPSNLQTIGDLRRIMETPDPEPKEEKPPVQPVKPKGKGKVKPPAKAAPKPPPIPIIPEPSAEEVEEAESASDEPESISEEPEQSPSVEPEPEEAEPAPSDSDDDVIELQDSDLEEITPEELAKGKGKAKGKNKRPKNRSRGFGRGKDRGDYSLWNSDKERKQKVEVPNFAGRKPVSKDEYLGAVRDAFYSLPSGAMSKVLNSKPPLHPDEINSLVRTFNKAKSVPPKELNSMIEKAQKFYATDPQKVPPPKMVKGPDGQKVPFDTLSPSEKGKALRKHRLQAVAMSYAAREAISSGLVKKSGVPAYVADEMADARLTKSDPSLGATPDIERASATFDNTMKSNEVKDVSDRKVSDLLRAAGTSEARRVAIGYCQAMDYKQARAMFLDPKSKNHISERQPPKEIARRLSKAMEFLNGRDDRYPANETVQDSAQVFKSRLLSRLETLLPPNQMREMLGHLNQHESANYERDQKRYEKLKKRYDAELEQTAKQYGVENPEDDVNPMFRNPLLNAKQDNTKSIHDRLAEKGVFRPRKPKKPLNYTGDSKGDPFQEAKSEWDDFSERLASSFTYLSTSSMDRKAVYWGVAPYPKGHEGFEPYRGWEQPHARDLGEKDLSIILASAKKWLRAPVLSSNIEGVVRDTQLRAALDLALRETNWESAVHPTIYNRLLAKLAGKSPDETLLTVRTAETEVRSTMPKKIAMDADKVNEVLTRLDRLASLVQKNHAKLGMSFGDAKDLVNHLDKTADTLEESAFGAESMLARQMEVLGIKTAEVIQQDSDEKYMGVFKNPMQPVQTEADEPYMKAYGDDQSSAVHHGKSTTGRPLAP